MKKDIVKKIDLILNEDDEAGQDVYYPTTVDDMLSNGWKLETKIPVGYSSKSEEYLVRFAKNGIVRWRKFKAEEVESVKEV